MLRHWLFINAVSHNQLRFPPLLINCRFPEAAIVRIDSPYNNLICRQQVVDLLQIWCTTANQPYGNWPLTATELMMHPRRSVSELDACVNSCAWTLITGSLKNTELQFTSALTASCHEQSPSSQRIFVAGGFSNTWLWNVRGIFSVKKKCWLPHTSTVYISKSQRMHISQACPCEENDTRRALRHLNGSLHNN